MPESNADDAFAEVAVSLGFMTREQVEECRKIQEELRARGQPPRTLDKISRDRQYTTHEQREEIRLELRKRGIRPMLGGYELLSKLGSGAMGVVYKARQVSLDRVVAIKVLNPELAQDGRFVERFEREARLAARLLHPNAVQIFDVRREAGKHFLVMEYVDGQPLSTDLKEGSIMDERRALQITRDVASALGRAHAAHVIHRDIKPSNILVCRDGTAKVNDLGIAKDLSGTTMASLTTTGTTVGTPRYMSPEQCLGDKEIDNRADIYSLGMTLFRMVCGRAAYMGATPVQVMQQHLSEPLPDPRQFNPSLSQATIQLIRDMTAKEREGRIQNCEEVVRRIERILSGAAEPAAPPPPPPPRPERQAAVQRRPSGAHVQPARKRSKAGLAGLLIAGVAALAIAGVVLWQKFGSTKPEVPSPEYVQAVARAREAEAKKDWNAALKAYRDARVLAGQQMINTADLDRASADIQQTIEQERLRAEYNQLEREALKLLGEDKWLQARTAYRRALLAADKLKQRPASLAQLQDRFAKAEKERKDQ